MKKLLSLGLLTVCALVISERQADAWVNSKFSVGLNWHLQSGNNNILWGMWKNGQVAGPEAFGGMPYGGGYIPFGGNPPAGTFPYFGANPQQMPPGHPAQTAPPPVQTTGQQTSYFGNPYAYNPYQTVGYQPNGYPPSPNYYNPNSYQHYGQAPFYWYLNR
jgi:hypothetical protein